MRLASRFTQVSTFGKVEMTSGTEMRWRLLRGLRGAKNVSDEMGRRLGSNGIVRIWVMKCCSSNKYIASVVSNALNGRTRSGTSNARLGVDFDATGRG